MKRIVKRAWAVLLCLCLCAGLCTVRAAAAVTAQMIRDFEGSTADLTSYLVNSYATYTIEKSQPLSGTASLTLHTSNAAGCYVNFPAAAGTNAIAFRVKTVGTCAVVRVGANGNNAHFKRSENTNGYQELTTADTDIVCTDTTGKKIVGAVYYDSAWGGWRFTSEFDGYVFLKNTGNIDISQINVGIFHGSTNADGFTLMLDDFFTFTGSDYAAVLAKLYHAETPAESLTLMQNFELGTDGFTQWMVDANATWSVDNTGPLSGKYSLRMASVNGSGCYVNFPMAAGTKDVGLRLKTTGTCGVLRVGANGSDAHYKRADSASGYQELTTTDFVFLNTDGTVLSDVASYDAAWGGIRFNTEFDGYLILKNTNAVSVSTLNIGIFHGSTNNEGFSLQADDFFAFTGTDYAAIPSKLDGVAEPSYSAGDFDGNGAADASDLAALQQALLKNTAAQNLLRDVNGDTVCDVRDLVRLKKVIAGVYDMGFAGDKFGLFVHYVPGYSVDCDGNTYSINNTANAFDAAQFAADVKSTGADYLIFTAWHSGMNPLYPSAVMNSYCPGHSATRDLIGDLLTEMEKVGIPVYLYTHPYLGYQMTDAERTATGYGTGNNPDDANLPNPETFDYDKWNDFQCAMYDELCERYEGRLAGLFLDEGTSNAKMGDYCDFARIRETVKSHGDLLMIQNFYGTNYACDVGMKEYGPGWGEFAGSASTWPCYEIPVGITCSQDWAATVASGTDAMRYTSTDMYRYTVLQAGCNTDGGGTLWAAGCYVGSGWEDGVLEALQAVGRRYRAAGCSLRNTRASTAYPTTSGTTLGKLSTGFVATTSDDGLVEYLHVLTAPSGQTLTISAPADGKQFGSANLLDGTVLTLTATKTGGYTITLPSGVSWDAVDTVICLHLSGRSTPSTKTVLVRDTDTRLTYTGNWEYSRWERKSGDYENDVHITATAGDSVTFTFTGTGIACIMPKSKTQGSFTIQVDGGTKLTYSAYSASYKAQQTPASRQNLTNGTHTVTITCVSGSLIIDGFAVTVPTA